MEILTVISISIIIGTISGCIISWIATKVICDIIAEQRNNNDIR